MAEGSWQIVITIEVAGEPFMLSQKETRELVEWLRTPNPFVPEGSNFDQTAAAVHLERLLEDPTASNPPMNDAEAGAIWIALGRMAIKDGVTPRQTALHDALAAYFVEQAGGE